MKTWDDWSDFDVNLAIAKKLGFVVSHESNGHSAVDARGDDGYNAWFNIDYCNQWNDMGPIIVESKITLIMIRSGYQAVNKDWDYIDLSGHDDINDCCIDPCALQYGHINPLRAAAIVFLMMNGIKAE